MGSPHVGGRRCQSPHSTKLRAIHRSHTGQLLRPSWKKKHEVLLWCTDITLCLRASLCMGNVCLRKCVRMYKDRYSDGKCKCKIGTTWELSPPWGGTVIPPWSPSPTMGNFLFFLCQNCYQVWTRAWANTCPENEKSPQHQNELLIQLSTHMRDKGYKCVRQAVLGLATKSRRVNAS